MSTTPKEVQEAAERRRKHIAAMSSNSREKSSYWIPIRQELSQNWEAADAFVLADAYLLSVREDESRRLSATAQWTDTPPTVYGSYWFKEEGFIPIIYDVFDDETEAGEWILCVEVSNNNFKNVKDMRGQWCGPIVPPGPTQSPKEQP